MTDQEKNEVLAKWAGFTHRSAKAQGSQQAMKPSVKARIAELVQLATTGAVLSITARWWRLRVVRCRRW